MVRIAVHPITGSPLELELSEDSVAALQAALVQRTGLAVADQRLVVRGKLLEERGRFQQKGGGCSFKTKNMVV